MRNQVDFEKGIRKGNLTTYEKLFDDYYVYLCYIALEYVKDKQIAEEIVSDVFFVLWEKRESIQITHSVSAYLIRAVKNKCINHNLHIKTEQRLIQNLIESQSYNNFSDDYQLSHLFVNDLTLKIKRSINELPEQCRQIFLLSREEELKYEDIAVKLNISINTVKTQMKIALSKLRVSLKDYLIVILFFIIFKV